MLNLVSGSYKPVLEEAFLARLRELKKHPLDPVLVVTASSRLKDHLERLMAEKVGAVLNVHFHTLGSLSAELVQEASALDKPVLSDPLFFDQLVKNLIRKNKPFESFEDMAVPDGFPSAVRSTLRDLLDSGVDEKLVAEAMEEKFVGRDVDVGSLKELLVLYRLYLEKLESLPVISSSKILEKAARLAEKSKFLKNFKAMLFYGFYDLTGRQVEFFESVVRAHPSTLFFPYHDHDADFEFAKRFRDNTLQSIRFEETIPEYSNGHQPEVSVFNVSGRHDEAWLIAREIRRLIDKGVDPSEIGVVARSRERLQGLPLRLEEAGIPTVTTAPGHLLDDPRVIADFALIKKTHQEKNNAPWTQWVEKSLEVIPELEGTGETASTRRAVREAVDSFANFNLLEENVSSDDFLASLQSRMTQRPWPSAPPKRGVSLLHAEAARGLSFKALLLIGMEERVFPRIIREDPFLRDDARFALRDTIGYKIGLKLTALEEERLLFRLLTEAAPKLIFIYQRSDDSGRVVGASPYLRDYLHRLGGKIEAVSVARSPFEKLRTEKLEEMSPSDAVLALQDRGQDKAAAEAVTALGGNGEAYAKGLSVQLGLQKFSNPTAYDGIIGDMTWNELFHRTGQGNASAFETFGKCPWQFFATKVLGLEEPDPIDPTQLPRREKGILQHGFLEVLFKTLTSEGTKPLPPEMPKDYFDKLFEEKIPVSIGEIYGIPSGLWKILRFDIREALRTYVKEEFARLLASGNTPIAFEKEWTGTLPAPLNVGPWRGTIDRIDKGPDGIDVVDYKARSVPKLAVPREALRGLRAQPPLYILIAELLYGKGPKKFSYHPLARDTKVKEMSYQEWETHREAILTTIRQQADLMKKGVFPILPASGGESYCDFCHVNRICRKHHSVSAYRAQQGIGAAPGEIREKNFEKKKSDDK